MENEELDEILSTIKSSSSKRTVFEKLIVLRRMVEGKDQFTTILEHGGIRILVGLLTKKYFNIVDISLSILGNCCREKKCAKEVIRYHGLHHLRHILQNWEQDSILCRTYRLLGNIAEFSEYTTEIFKFGFVALVVKTLNDSISSSDKKKTSSKHISMGTQDMAIRTLRMLCKNISNRETIISDQGVKAVSMVMIRYTDEWCKENNEQAKQQLEKFLKHVLKCMLAMASMVTSNKLIQQICADGNGFKSLVSLIDLDPLVPVQCLTKVTHYAISRSDIQNAAAVIKILEKTKVHRFRKSTNTESESDALLTALWLLSRHPMNRNEIRENNGLEIILNAMRRCECSRYRYKLLLALNCFQNHERSQQVLASNGIVTLMVDLLERYLHVTIGGHLIHMQLLAFKRLLEDKSPKNFKRQKRCDVSPPPSLSPMSSPGCTPPRNCDGAMEEDDDDSDNYSPVCSDNEDLEQVHVMDTPEKQTQVSQVETTNPSAIHYKITSLIIGELLNVAHLELAAVELRSYRTIQVLVSQPDHPLFCSIVSILVRVLSNVDNLIPLIENKVVQLLAAKAEHIAGCYSDQDIRQVLSDTADTHRGRAMILKEMERDDDLIDYFVCIPYLIKKRNLPKMLKFMHGLDVLMKHFVNGSARCDIACSLHFLAESCDIRNPTVDEAVELTTDDEIYKFESLDKNTVTFRLDDGSLVSTDRDFLVQSSGYFRALLSGSFKESNEKTVEIKNVSSSSLRCILNLLQNQCECSTPRPLNMKLSTLLEVIKLTDIYLLVNLNEWLTLCAESYTLAKDNAVEIYTWSVTSGTNFLRIETVAFLLTAMMDSNERCKSLENIVDAGFPQQITADVKQLFHNFLKN